MSRGSTSRTWPAATTPHGAPRLLPTLVAFALLVLPNTSAQSAERANVVLLLADDLGYGNISSQGGDIPTPHIDSIGENGVRFTSGYVTAPVCSPSRHGLMTGRYQQRWGKELNSQTVPPVGQRHRRDLPLDETTIADAMRAAGYTTGAFGKWHLSWRDDFHPLARGFDEFVGLAIGMSHLDPAWPTAHLAPPPDLQPTASPPPGLFRGREPIALKEYLTDQLAREAVAFIERNKDHPFLLYVPFLAVHSPIQVTDDYYRRVRAYDDDTRRIFGGMIVSLDDAVGAILAKLRETGLEERTLVIFASDNGAEDTWDVDRVNNRPLVGHKRQLYEGGIRVPFAMQWKGHLPARGAYTLPASTLDIVPTALAAAGVSDVARYRLDGVNLLPYLKGKKDGAPHEHLFWRSGPNAAVRHGSWKLLMSGSGLTRLYDVDRDMSESKDLSEEHPDRVRLMKQAFDAWAKDMAPPREAARTVKTTHNGDEIDWHI